MHHVFLSYSHADAPFVTRVVEALGSRGVDVWIDRTDLPLSLPWLDEVRRAIDEAALVVVVESAHWQRSAPCAAELRMAQDLGVQLVHVDPQESVDDVVRTVVTAVEAVGPQARARTELRVAARTWSERGQASSLLASTASQRSWQRASDGRRTAVEELFLRASRRRSRRRKGLVYAGVTLGVVGFAVRQPLLDQRVLAQQQTQQAALESLDVESSLRDAVREPYYGLQQAAASASGRGALDGERLAAALRWPTPDRRIPAAAGTRLPAVVDGPVRLLPGPGRRLSATTADGREVALADGRGVLVRSVANGSVLLRLIGAPEAVNDVAWSRDGTRVWALSGGSVLSWQRRSAPALLSTGETWTGAVLAPDGVPWLFTEAGRVLGLDGQPLLPEALSARPSAVAAGAGGRAVVTTASAWHVLDLRRRTVQEVAVDGCGPAPGTAAVTQDGLLVGACDDLRLVTVELATGTVRASLSTPDVSRAVALLGDSGRVAVGADRGAVFVTTPALERREAVHLVQCAPGTLGFAVSPDGDGFAPYGSGTGHIGCTQRAVRTGEGWRWDSFSDVSELAYGSHGASYSLDGRALALGIGGDVVVHPVNDLLPSLRHPVCGDVVTGVLTLSATSILVLCSDGAVHEVPVFRDPLTNAGLGALVRERLAVARRLGLTDLQPLPVDAESKPPTASTPS